MKKLLSVMFAFLLVAFFTACNKSTVNEGNGQLVIKITDAPFPIDMVESASVTITKIELRETCDSVCDGDPYITVMEEPVTMDLLELRNGITAKLPEIDVPQGNYNLVRIYVDQAELKIKDGGSYNVKVPSGQQTGIKIFINPALVVEGGLSSELLLDFDLSRSFVVRGTFDSPHGINGFIFKPVVRAVNNSAAGRILGMVTDTAMVKLANALVWLKKDTTISQTFTDSLGHYAFIGVPAGNYSVFATRENYDTAGYNDVKVVSGNMTIKDFMLMHK